MSCCQCNPTKTAETKKDATEVSWFRIGALIILGGLSMYLSLAINISPSAGIARTIIHSVLAAASALAILLAAPPIFRNALVSKITLEQLFLIGILGSFIASLYSSFTGIGHIYYEVVVILLAIYHLGQAITRFQIKRFSNLESQIPGFHSFARLVTPGGDTNEIPIETVNASQLLEIRPGEVVPADGVIENGSAFIEQLAHTGEPFPSPLTVGGNVLAGSRVLDGTIFLRCTSSGSDRELDRLLTSCSASGESTTDSIAQKTLRFFIPAVVIIALLTVLFWSLAGSLSQALFNGLAVTIVACPCGIGLAIPLAIRNGNLRLRLLGLVPHSSDLLERFASVDSVVFDKTGTLFDSAIKLENITISPSAPPDFLGWLAAIQRHSTHPIARPLWKVAAPIELEDLQITPIPARGISTSFSSAGKRHSLTLCNSIYLAENKLEQPAGENKNRTVYFILNGELAGQAMFQEQSREGALEAISQILAAEYSVEILTGDSTISDKFSSLVPCSSGLTTRQKAEIIEEKQQCGKKVLFVGDGLNDTEAMCNSHASIALGTEAHAASSVATATLAHYDLKAILEALRISHFTKKRLNRLLLFTLSYNLIGIGFACSGYLHPVIAAILMLASSMSVLAFANRSEKKQFTPH